MKLKVGDKVRVRTDLEIDIYSSLNNTGEVDFTEEMEHYRGEIVEITYVDECGIVEINDCDLCWVDTMFEEVAFNEN